MPDAYIGNSDVGKVLLPFEVLKRHFIALGSSGSGKTVLCKALIEEAARNKIPSVIVDSQGDLASLALTGDLGELEKYNITKDMLDSFEGNSRVVVFTPCSSKGIAVCINPLKLPEANIEEEELVNILKEISNSIASLLGYKADDKGESVKSLLYCVLEHCHRNKINLQDFNELIDLIQELPGGVREKTQEIVSNKDTGVLVKKLRLLTTGGKELLFNFGVPLDIKNFLKKGQVNVFYLNTLKSEAEKHFFVSMLATNIYNWMLSSPSKELQLLFYIDEIGEFLPAGARKPAAKDILNLLYKQARKYGIGCVVSTQNPGDIDYRAFAQFNSWAVGRLMTRQDITKVKGALSSISPKFSQVLSELPKLKPAEFFLFSPDYNDNIVKFKTRYSITKHKTLTADEIKGVVKPDVIDSFERMKISKKHSTAKKTSKLHIKINVSKDQLNNIAENLKKKSFVFFGRKKESVDSIKLLFIPLYLCTVRRSKKILIKRKVEEFNIYFDALSGDLVKLQNNKIQRFDGFGRMIGLKDIEILTVKALYAKERELSIAELSKLLNISEPIVKSTLTTMMKKKLILSRQKNLFGLYFSLNIPLDISKQSSGLQVKTNEAVENPVFLEEKVDFKKLKKTFESLFDNTEIVGNELIYCPVYEVRLSSNNKSRIFRISAVNGKVTS